MLVVTHGGLVYTIEDHLGADHGRLANAEGRWLDIAGDRLRLGERILLADPDDLTVPGQIDRQSDLGLGLVLGAEPGGRHRGQRRSSGSSPARLAGAVGPGVEPLQRPVDVGQLGLHLLEDRELLLPLEGVAGGVGQVLVHVGQVRRRCGPLVVDVPVVHVRSQVVEPGALLGQAAPGVVVVHGTRLRRAGRRWGWRGSNPRASA